eukprot:jgi/Ulvmu1/215/UM001_0219.1
MGTCGSCVSTAPNCRYQGVQPSRNRRRSGIKLGMPSLQCGAHLGGMGSDGPVVYTEIDHSLIGAKESRHAVTQHSTCTTVAKHDAPNLYVHHHTSTVTAWILQQPNTAVAPGTTAIDLKACRSCSCTGTTLA